MRLVVAEIHGHQRQNVIRGAKSDVGFCKGRQWSESVYTSRVILTEKRLRAEGATDEQIAEFKSGLAKKPFKGGGVNTYSGD